MRPQSGPGSEGATVRYTDPLGRTRRVRLDTDEFRLALQSEDIAEIDLSGLESCKGLEVIDLSRNQLKEVDLTPIAGSRWFKRLGLDRETKIYLEKSLKTRALLSVLRPKWYKYYKGQVVWR